ncbi:MAG TPA: hypothetical protein VHB79_34220 [Polyangiaceae bacterium]|nr:hypothetical protein [Polyangiaceae bacterium]
MRRFAVFAAASLLATIAAPAWAAGDCPDGDWFCEPAPPAPESPPAAPPGPDQHRQPSPRPAQPAEPPLPAEMPPYPPPPGPPLHDDDMYVEAQVEPQPIHRRRRYREWGLNLHGLIGLMGSDAKMSPDADMNGMGAALRFRPARWFALEAAFEAAWGTDYNGFQRSEQALMMNAMFFVNPRSALQLYALAGLSGGAAFLDGTDSSGQRVLRDETYGYFGGQLGVGLEARITRHFVLGGDLVGFLRGRRDRGAGRNPEFVDPDTGRTTNTSSGAFVRLGATFYW